MLSEKERSRESQEKGRITGGFNGKSRKASSQCSKFSDKESEQPENGKLSSFKEELANFNVTFTTPCLDFEDHSCQLRQIISRLYDLYKQTGETGEKRDESTLVLLCFEVLKRFNLLTRPPQKKYRALNSTVYTPSSMTEADLLEMSTHNFDPTLSNQQKAFYHYLRGKVFNIFPMYNAAAEENLSRSVKLDPRLLEAWKELGECFWKKGDVEGAENCFMWILDYIDENHVVAMSLLAMVQRKKMNQNGLQKSIELCKKALKLDLGYSDAWVGLGASYLSVYFNASRNFKDLKLALAAFDKAVSNSSTNPDLFHSRAIIYQYFEQYEQAISDLKHANSLDATLDTKDLIASIKAFRDNLVTLMNTKLGMSAQTISSMQKRFPEKGLVGEVYVQALGEGVVDYQANSKMRLQIMKCVMRYNEAVGSSFIAMDTKGSFCVLTVLNVQVGTIKVADQLIIAKPVGLFFGEGKHPLIRVDDPYQILLNQKPIPASDMAWVEMRVEAKN